MSVISSLSFDKFNKEHAINICMLQRGEIQELHYSDQLVMLIAVSGVLLIRDKLSNKYRDSLEEQHMVITDYDTINAVTTNSDRCRFILINLSSQNLSTISYIINDIKEGVTPKERQNIYSLRLKPILKGCLDNLQSVILNEDVTNDLKEYICSVRWQEILYIISKAYTLKEVSKFFLLVKCSQLPFKEKVYVNKESAKTSTQLAALCGYSTRDFARKFNDIFHTSPYKWMQEQKANEILEQLKTDAAIKDIIFQFEFSSAAHFTNFCKKRFNKTPSEIRKEYGKFA